MCSLKCSAKLTTELKLGEILYYRLFTKIDLTDVKSSELISRLVQIFSKLDYSKNDLLMRLNENN